MFVILFPDVSQIIMLYTLNLYSALCQLHLNKTERGKKNIPCSNAFWITDNPLCTCYSLSDVILQQRWKRGGEKWK